METQINKKYMQLMFLCCFAYFISYISRLAYNTNIANVITTYNVTKTKAGYVTSAFFFCYGAGQLINGMLCGKFNSRILVTISLMISSVISIIMFFVTNIYVMAVLWAINGFMLSTLWCNLINIISIIKNEKYVQKSVVVMSISLPLGTVFAYGLSSLLTYLDIWKTYYVISFITVLVGGLFFYIALNKVQNSINKQLKFEVEQEKQQVKVVDNSNNKSLLNFLKIAIIPIFLISVTSSMIKDGVQTWMPSYLKENYSLPNYFSILVTLLVPLLGITASIIAKFVVDKTKNMFFANAVFFSISSIMLIIIYLVTKLPIVVLIVFFALLSTLNHSIASVLTAIFPLYNKGIINSGKTAGIMNAFAYVGTTLSSILLGSVADNFGWKACMFVLFMCAIVSIVLSLWGCAYMKSKNSK